MKVAESWCDEMFKAIVNKCCVCSCESAKKKIIKTCLEDEVLKKKNH